jgi:hypothetical protein
VEKAVGFFGDVKQNLRVEVVSESEGADGRLEICVLVLVVTQFHMMTSGRRDGGHAISQKHNFSFPEYSLFLSSAEKVHRCKETVP